MTIEELKSLKEKLSKLSEQERVNRDLYLKKLQTGEIERPTTGYPTIDKPWLKYYDDELIKKGIPMMSAYDFLKERNKDRMNKIALNYYGNKFTFQDFVDKIDTTAKALVESGVKPGDIVSISLPNMPEVAYLYYALSKIGAVANMIDPRTSAEGIKEYIEEANSDILFIVDSYYSKVKPLIENGDVREIITVSPSESLPFGLNMGFKVKTFIESFSNPDLKVEKTGNTIDWKEFYGKGLLSEVEVKDTYYHNRPSLIEHTGGTTGTPKGVLLSDDNINAMAYQSSVFPVDLQSKHKWLDVMPPFIAYGIGSGLHFPLILGMETILIPQFNPDELDKLVLKYHPNHICGAPTHWNYFIKSKRLENKDLSYLITCAIGGDAISEETEKKANEFLRSHGCQYDICKGYGMTETNGGICRTTLNTNKIGAVGVPFVKSSVGIFDPETNEELPFNTQGEIRMAGANVMLEYLNKPEQTSEIKQKDVDGEDWIHSGDIGYMDEDGNIFVVNRMKRIIIRHDGFKIFPSNIERVINTHPGVDACAVVGVKDTQNNQGRLPYAFIKPVDDSVNFTKLAEEIDELCHSQLPEYSQLDTIDYIDKIPMTPIGKVDALKLEQIAEKRKEAIKVLKK